MTTIATYPACWPGTSIIKSRHNAFNWQRTDHTALSIIAADGMHTRTPLYNQWRQARIDAPETTADWPEYRDTHAAQEEARRVARQQARKAKPKGGFQANSGTIPGVGESRTAKLLQPKPATFRLPKNAPKAMHLVRAPSGQPLTAPAQGRHGGAYSRAVAATCVNDGKNNPTNPSESHV